MFALYIITRNKYLHEYASFRNVRVYVLIIDSFLTSYLLVITITHARFRLCIHNIHKFATNACCMYIGLLL